MEKATYWYYFFLNEQMILSASRHPDSTAPWTVEKCFSFVASPANKIRPFPTGFARSLGPRSAVTALTVWNEYDPSVFWLQFYCDIKILIEFSEYITNAWFVISLIFLNKKASRYFLKSVSRTLPFYKIAFRVAVYSIFFSLLSTKRA